MLIRFVAGLPAFYEWPVGNGESIFAGSCDIMWFCSGIDTHLIHSDTVSIRFLNERELSWTILTYLKLSESWSILNYLELSDCLALLRWWPDQLRRVREDDDGQVSHERKLRAFQSLSSCAQQTQLWCTEPVACRYCSSVNRLYHGLLLDVCNKAMQAKVQFDSSTFICRCYKPNHESSHNYVPVP